MENLNAVVEGNSHYNLKIPLFKLVNLEIPENVFLIDDTSRRFNFYGVTNDFKKIERRDLDVGTFKRVDRLSLCPGIVLPYRGEFKSLLENPRTVILKDGRVFVENGIRRNLEYMRLLHGEIISEAGEALSAETIGFVMRAISYLPKKSFN